MEIAELILKAGFGGGALWVLWKVLQIVLDRQGRTLDAAASALLRMEGSLTRHDERQTEQHGHFIDRMGELSDKINGR